MTGEGEALVIALGEERFQTVELDNGMRRVDIPH